MKKTKKKSIRRFLALVLALVVWVSSVPTSTFAAEADHVHNEDGWTCEQMESSETLTCEIAEHQHSDDCYKETSGELVCENEEDHEHTDECYTSATPELACDQAEHTHTDDCYEIIDGEWNCIKAEDVLESGEQQPEEQQPEEKAETYTLSFSVEGAGNVTIQIGGESIDLSAVKDVAKEDEVSFKLLPEENTEVKSVSASGAEIEKLEGSENEYVVRNVMSDEVVVSIEVEGTIADEMGLPEAVQAFLDAVEALPSVGEVTAENAEEIGNQVNAVIDMWERLDAELSAREDVTAALEKVYAIYHAVLAAEESSDIAILASGYVPVENVTIEPDRKPNGNIASGKVRQSGQSLTMKVGQKASFLLGAPTNTLYCPSHGYVFAQYTPSDYCDISLIDNSRNNLVGNPTYAAGNNSGERVFDTVFDALKPGISSDVRVCYYANFGIVFTNGASQAYLYCPYGHNVIVKKDVTWYRYNDIFAITVNADYVLKYDANANGESVENMPSDDIKTIAEEKAEFTIPNFTQDNPEPTRAGYTFLGWAEIPEATEAQYKGGEEIILNWSEGFGSTDNPVSKTLYAVWKEGTTIAPLDTTYTVVREYYINGEIIATVTIADKAGKVGDEIVGAALAEANPNWSLRTVEGEKRQFTFDGSNPEILTLVEAADKNVITLKYVLNETQGETPTPTATPEETPIPTATPEETPTSTATPEETPTPTATPENPTPTETPEETPTPTATPENPTPTETPEETPTPTATPEETPTPTATPEETPAPTATPENPTPTATPEETPTPTVTPEETPAPTATPETPTPTATPEETPAPTATPGATATPEPTATPGATATPEPTTPTSPTNPTTPTEPEVPTPPQPPVIEVVPEVPEVVTPESPDVLVVIPDEDIARAVVYERVQDPVTEELSYEVNEEVPVLEEVPEVVEEESPDTVIILDEDVPQSYVKVQDPVTEDYVYIPEEDVPLASIGTPQTGDTANGNLWMTLFMVSLSGMAILVSDSKRRKRNH